MYKLIIPALLFVMFISSCTKDDEIECQIILDGVIQTVILDQAPELLEGNDLLTNLKYPAEARENNIEGTVVLQYEISHLGVLEEVRIIEDIGAGCGQACLDAADPNLGTAIYSPGIYNGVPVYVFKSIEVKFRLE